MGLLRSVRFALASQRNRSHTAFEAQRRLVTTKTPTIFDVGAHLGEASRKYRTLYPAAEIHAFEPFADSFEALCEQVADGDPNIHAHALAVGASNGRSTFNLNRSPSTNSLLASDVRGSGFWGGRLLDTQALVDVPITTLDAFCEAQAIEHVDLLKLDVQGAEYDVLIGARGLMETHAIDAVYVELIVVPTYEQQRGLHEYLALFETHRYVLLDAFNLVRTHGRLLQLDLLFASESFLAGRTG